MEETTEKVKDEKPIKTAVIRNGEGLFQPGTAPGPGRPKETEEQKIKKKALKELIKDYKNSLTEALPEISPALIERAKARDIQAIKEIHEVLGMHKNIVVGGDESDNPIKVQREISDDEIAKIAKNYANKLGNSQSNI